MARAGRPPKEPEEKFDKSIRIRMRQADYEMAEKAAGRAGLSVSAWTRSRLIESAREELEGKKR
jgi:predicted HicB family RNase H-like nuclease